MSESCGEEQTRWITTVIISSALQYQHGVDNYSDHEISTVLQRQQHRVRYSESVETGSVIFPLSGIAFILSDTQDLLRTGEEEFSKRIQKFINIHRNSFLVLSAALHGPEEWNVMFRIQRRYSSPVPAVDCHSWPQRSDYCNEVFDLYLLEERPDMFKCSVCCPSIKLITLNLDLLLLEAKLFIEIDFHGSRFLGSNLRVIPVHNPAETVKLMLTMAKITSKPQADDTRCKVEMTKAQIIEKSPVWKMLQEYQSHCN